MLLLLYVINSTLSQLVIRSPEAISDISISYSSSTFGTPALFQIYGKLEIVTETNCELFPSTQNDFILVDSQSSCEYEDLALSAQNQGARLIIFPQSELKAIYPTNKAKASNVNIVCIGIQSTKAELLKNYKDFNIWVTFGHQMSADSSVEFNLMLSGNYTLDYAAFKPIIEINNLADFDSSTLGIALSYLQPDDSLIVDEHRDCYKSKNGQNTYCMVTEAGVDGVKKVQNSIAICRYFRSSNLDIDTFFSALQSLYEKCEFDYSKDCIENYIPRIDPQVQYYVTNSYRYAPYYILNEIYFFWPDYLIKGAYLSISYSNSPKYNCEANCSTSYILNSYCDLSCNSSSCGYDNLNCLYTGNCLNFLIGDGQCDEQCSQDTDCPLYCTEGCSYSDLESGLCPASCTGDCFKECDQDLYCSPGCSYSDLNVGICSDTCTDECLQQCETECATGCLYSDLYNDLCPSNCTGDCFNLCNSTLYCSPACSYSDLNAGQCSETCSKDCLSQCKITQCSPGCYYSDWQQGICSKNCSDSCYQNCTDNICNAGCLYSTMESGQCPGECSTNCFDHCNRALYCSPGCKYSDWKEGVVSDYCTDRCQKKYNLDCYLKCDYDYNCTHECGEECCDQSEPDEKESKVKVLALIVSITVISVLIIVGIIIAVIISKRKRNLNNIVIVNEQSEIVNQLKHNKAENSDLRPIQYNHSLHFIGDAICTIDISGFKLGDPVIITPCLHIFHPNCIFEWLNSNQREKRCPNCNLAMDNMKVHKK